MNNTDLRQEFASGNIRYAQTSKTVPTQEESYLSPRFSPPIETPTTARSQSPAIDKRYRRHVDSLIRLQALWRGYSDRKAVMHVQRSSAPNHSYFSLKEIRETLSAEAPPEHRSQQDLFTYSSGATYQGEWVGGFRDGYGTMTWPDGSSFIGNWAYSKPLGLGKFLFFDGDEFEGSWRMAKFPIRRLYKQSSLLDFAKLPPDGYVWLLHKHESNRRAIQAKPVPVKKPEPIPAPSKLQFIYERQRIIEETLDKLKPSYAKGAFMPSQKTLAGERGFKHMKYPDQSVYTGEWLENRRDGRGKLIHMNGDVYEGEWIADRKEGMGKQTWADGSQYIGGFKANQKDGLGEYNWADRSRYLGEWKNNQIHGQGRYVWMDGRMYVGEWAEGLMEGYGELLYKDGKRYVGMWCKGKKHGDGFTLFKDGSKLEQTWERGKLRTSA